MKIFGLRFFEYVKIGDPQDLLLKRWILFRCKAWGIYLHKFMRSDYDRALHDHPWPFISVILKQGYWEEHDQTRDGRKTLEWRRPGSVLLRPGQWRHRVVLSDNKPSWSLILVGRRFKAWGFFLPTGWCWWRQHNPVRNICEDEIIHTGGED